MAFAEAASSVVAPEFGSPMLALWATFAVVVVASVVANWVGGAI